MPQLQSSARDARLHRSDTYLQRPGDLFITESFDVAQNNGLAIRSPQTLKRLAQLRFSLMRQGFLLGTRRIVARQRCGERFISMLVGRIKRNGHIALSPPPPAPAISRLIDGDAIDPGFQRRVAAKPSNTLEGSQKSLLSQIACLFGVGRQPVQERINITRVLSDQTLISQRIAT